MIFTIITISCSFFAANINVLLLHNNNQTKREEEEELRGSSISTIIIDNWIDFKNYVWIPSDDFVQVDHQYSAKIKILIYDVIKSKRVSISSTAVISHTTTSSQWCNFDFDWLLFYSSRESHRQSLSHTINFYELISIIFECKHLFMLLHMYVIFASFYYMTFYDYFFWVAHLTRLSLIVNSHSFIHYVCHYFDFHIVLYHFNCCCCWSYYFYYCCCCCNFNPKYIFIKHIF